MSIDAIRWAWMIQKLRPSQKLILLSLADRADDNHACWPSIDRLSKDTGLDERSIYRNIKILADMHLISIESCHGGRPNKYHLLGVNGRENEHCPPVTECHPDNLSPCHDVTVTECHPDKNDTQTLTFCQSNPDTVSAQRARLHNEPKEEPKENPQTRARANGGLNYSASFLEFWDAFPKKVGKDAAFKAWKNAKKKHQAITPGQLVAAIRAQSKFGHFLGKDGENYVPNPATWLNQGRWSDEIIESRARASPQQPVKSWQERESESNKQAFLRSLGNAESNTRTGA